MIFVYKEWERFCSKLAECGQIGITAQSYIDAEAASMNFVLKHDVETNPKKALQMAKIENKYGHKGSYYVQAYLLDKQENINILKEIQSFGHEVSYHYDVMDSNKGDIQKAIREFDKNIKKFRENGFDIVTVCQHGNPVIERVGYTSNRDFFRNDKVRALYPEISDIMVNYPEKAEKTYNYYSDAGRKFNLIYDPVNNDVVKSDEKNIPYKNLDKLYEALIKSKCDFIISTHPHRWMSSGTAYIFRATVFKIVKTIAKLFTKIPLLNKIMSKYYYLAKKI